MSDYRLREMTPAETEAYRNRVPDNSEIQLRRAQEIIEGLTDELGVPELTVEMLCYHISYGGFEDEIAKRINKGEIK